MDASQTCDVLLTHLKMSNLNWNLVESPFSVTISVKKSFFKDKSGHPQSSGLSYQNVDQMARELNMLRRENNSLQEALNKVGIEHFEAKESLKTKTKEAEDLHATSLDLRCELSQVRDELLENQVESTKDKATVTKLKNAKKHLESQQKEFKQIYETMLAETDDKLKANNEKIHDLTKEAKALKEKLIRIKKMSPDLNQNLLEAKVGTAASARTVSSNLSSTLLTTNTDSFSSPFMDSNQNISTVAAANTFSPLAISTSPPVVYASASPAVSSSSRISLQKRIQCDKCDRKCMDKKDMECHILLWHSDFSPSRNSSFDVKEEDPG